MGEVRPTRDRPVAPRTVERMSTSRPRSLADDLRARDDAALVALLRARPDLLSPVPSDLASLAARATTRPSVSRALDQLDRFALQVVEVLCALPDRSTAEDVRRLLGADPDAVLDLLHLQALVYRDDEGGIVVPRTVVEVVGPPDGLGPALEQALHTYGPARLARIAGDLGATATGDPVTTAHAIAAVLGDEAKLTDLLAAAPHGAAEALATMVWGPPTGHLERARRDVDGASAASPVEWLLAHALLVATDTATVVLPARGGAAPARRPGAPDGRADPARARHVAGRPEPRRPGGRRGRGGRRPAGRGAARAVGRRAAQGAAGRRHRRAGTGPRRPGAGRRRAPAGAAGRDRARRRTAGPRRRQQRLGRGLAAAHRRTTGGWTSRSRPAGWCWPGPGWRRPGCPAWSGPGTSGTAPSPRSAPTWTAPSRPLVRAAVLADLAALPEGVASTTASLSARLRWQAPRRGGRLQDDLVDLDHDRGADPRAGDRRRARGPRPAARRRRRRRRGGRPPAGAAASRWTTCCSRPTSRRWRPGRWTRRWPARCGWWPTWSPPAGPPSTGSPRRPCGGPSTPGGPRVT